MAQTYPTPEDERVFAVASDEAMVELITAARKRLVIVAPAFSVAVADALIAQFPKRPTLQMTVIIDADPEVYRLGFGAEEALKRLHDASLANDFALRKQAGVRIGLIVSDDATMIFAPTALLIEAGSKTPEKPNAVIVRGALASQIAAAAGGDGIAPKERQEIGEQPIKKAEIDETRQNLNENPVQSFDIARALRVFTSKVQYVDFKARGYKLDRKVVPLPRELMDVEDDGLRERISARIRSPLSNLGAVEMQIERDGKTKPEQVDGRWFDKERTRIENAFLYSIPGYGKVVLYTKRADFRKEAEGFEDVIRRYIDEVRARISKQRESFITTVVAEYLPRWRRRPPAFYDKFQIAPTDENMEADLKRIAGELFDRSVDFAEPFVRIVPKNIAPESMRDAEFKNKVESAFRRRGAPEYLIRSLFAELDAAPGGGSTFR